MLRPTTVVKKERNEIIESKVSQLAETQSLQNDDLAP